MRTENFESEGLFTVTVINEIPSEIWSVQLHIAHFHERGLKLSFSVKSFRDDNFGATFQDNFIYILTEVEQLMNSFYLEC